MEKIRSKTYRSHVRQMFGELSDTVQRLLQLRQDDSEKKLLEAFERLLGVRIEHLR